MPLINDAELARDIRNGEIASLYYFFGKDVAMIEAFTKKLLKKLVPDDMRAMDLQSFDGKNLDLSRLSDSCEVFPMLSDRVAVTINDLNADSLGAEDYKFLTRILSDLPETTTVIIYATGVDLYKSRTRLSDKNSKLMEFCSKNGVACDFALKSVNDMGKTILRRVERNGCTISKKAAEHLAEMCAGDTVLANSETDKLCAFADGGEITLETVDKLCVRRLDTDSFKLASAIARKDTANAFRILDELYSLQTDSFMILSAVSMSFIDLYRAVTARAAGKNQSDVQKDFSYPQNRSFAVKNAFRDSSNIRPQRIRKCMILLSKADMDMKSLRTDNRLILEKAVAQMLA